VSTCYQAIPPEPWGWKLKRARWDLNHMTLNDAVRLAGYYMAASEAAISRLESAAVAPHGPRSLRMRQLAYVLCLVYNVDPAEFGLSGDDPPPGWSIPPRTLGPDGRPSVTRWYVTAAA